MRTRVAVACVLVALLSATACGNGAAKASLPATPPARPVISGVGSDAPAEPARTVVRVPTTNVNSTLTGTTEPHRRSTLMPLMPGVVDKVLFAEGQSVKAGAPLVILKTEDFVLRVRQAEAGMEAATAQYDAAALAYERMRGLRGKEAVAQGQLDQVEAGYKGAKAGLSNAKVMSDMARKALRDTTVYCPYDAVVVRRMISEGESAYTMPPTPLAVIEQTGLLDLKLQVPAIELARLQVGTPLVIRFPATNQEVTATVTNVVPSANPGSRTFTVIVELPNEDGTLKAGLYAEARLTQGAPAGEAAR
jgi:multidrug efflux system membrane fusion protein